MKRTLLAASLVALTTLAGCGDAGGAATAGAPPTSAGAGSATPAGAAPTTPAAPVTVAPVGAPAPGVPALTGTPTDLSKPVQAQAGSGQPPAGLVLQDLVVGAGPPATLADTVGVRYTGTVFADGTLFDSSWSQGDAPVSFPLSNVVPGFAQGIEGMQAGGRRVLVIPPDLAYGDDSPTETIPPGSTLVFVVDLVGIG